MFQKSIKQTRSFEKSILFLHIAGDRFLKQVLPLNRFYGSSDFQLLTAYLNCLLGGKDLENM